MTAVVTIEIPTNNKAAARGLLEAAGFTVTRVTLKRVESTITPADPNQRASARTDMPERLDDLERAAYMRGYGKAAMSYTKKHGLPSGAGVPMPEATLLPVRVDPTREEMDAWLKQEWAAIKASTRQHEWDRHPICHKAAMTELQKWQAHWAEYTNQSAAYRRSQIREVGAA